MSKLQGTRAPARVLACAGGQRSHAPAPPQMSPLYLRGDFRGVALRSFAIEMRSTIQSS